MTDQYIIERGVVPGYDIRYCKVIHPNRIWWFFDALSRIYSRNSTKQYGIIVAKDTPGIKWTVQRVWAKVSVTGAHCTSWFLSTDCTSSTYRAEMLKTLPPELQPEVVKQDPRAIFEEEGIYK